MRELSLVRWLAASSVAGMALTVALTSALAAQNPPTQPPPAAKVQLYRYRLLGVYDDATGEPIEGVEVSDALGGASSPTSKSGTVSLFFLPDGGTLVRLRKVGYDMQTFPVAISPADTAPVTVALHRSAQQLATVMVKDSAPKYVSAVLRGAEERLQSHNGGYFIDEAKMRKYDNSTMANALLANMLGLTSVQQAHGRLDLVSSRTPCASVLSGCKSPNCFINVYIDGVSSAMRPDFNHLSTMDYAIAEFYPGGAAVPPQYGGTGAGCGVLLLWTRER